MAYRNTRFLKVDVRHWDAGRAAIKKLTARGWALVTDKASETFVLEARSGIEVLTPELVLTFERFGDPRLLRLNADRLTEMIQVLRSACSDGFEIDWTEQAEDCFCYTVVRHHPQPHAVLSNEQLLRGTELRIVGDPIFMVGLFRWRRSWQERLLGPEPF